MLTCKRWLYLKLCIHEALLIPWTADKLNKMGYKFLTNTTDHENGLIECRCCYV